MTISIFRRVYLVVGGVASGVAFGTALGSFIQPSFTPIGGALFGLGLAAFGGAFQIGGGTARRAEYKLNA